MENPRCGDCRFFKPDGGTTAYGVCFRFPQPVGKHRDDFCGEFQNVKPDVPLREPAKPASSTKR